MKTTLYLFLSFCLVIVLSCTRNDVKPQYKPILLEADDLNGSLQDTVQGYAFQFHALQILDEQYLLIRATLPFALSRLYRYNLFDGSILPMEELIHGDLRYITISNHGDELVLVNRDSEVLVIDIESMMVKHRFPTEHAISYKHHHLVASSLYYRSYMGQQIQVNQLNLESGEESVLYTVDRSVEKEGNEFATLLEWEIYESANQMAHLLTIDRLSGGQIGLVHYGLAENQLIWQVGLEEFEAAEALPPKKVVLKENKVYVISDDYISCRFLADGALIWSTPRIASEATPGNYSPYNYPVSIFEDMVIAAGEDYIEAFHTADGRLAWSVQDVSSDVLNWSRQPSVSRHGDYLMVNLIPIDIRTGHILWNERPDIEGPVKILQTNHPYIDLDDAVVYYLFEGIMYKWQLPPID
jgi:hypothetical protein